MKRPINPGRLILATIISPAIGAFLMIVVMTIFDQGAFDDPLGYFEFIGSVAGMGTLLVGWPAMLIIGLPLHGWLCHKSKRHWARYVGLGAIGGLIPALVFGLFDEVIPFPLLLIGAATGSLTAILFHLIRGPHLALTEPANLPT